MLHEDTNVPLDALGVMSTLATETIVSVRLSTESAAGLDSSPKALCEEIQYELRFESLFKPGLAYAFPCDAAGHVNLDSLSQTARENYLFARTMVGREFSMPAVMVTPHDLLH